MLVLVRSFCGMIIRLCVILVMLLKNLGGSFRFSCFRIELLNFLRERGYIFRKMLKISEHDTRHDYGPGEKKS